MSKANKPARHIIPDHSAAKVRVFTRYLGIYLSILGRTKNVDSVYIYDLMCGEGEYADSREGSALKGLREVLRYLTQNPTETLHIYYLLNDAGMSDIEPGRSKIERVQQKAALIPFEPTHQQRLTVAYRTLLLDNIIRCSN